MRLGKLLVLFAFLLLSMPASSQSSNDVIYMKDGSVVKGKIIEQASKTSITIKTSAGVRTYQLDEVEKFVQTSQFGGNNGRVESAHKSIHHRIRQVDTKSETTLVCTTSIGNWAFYKNKGLTEVTIGESVTKVGTSAFRNCKGLKSTIIGESVTSIGRCAFVRCSGLMSIYSLNPEPPSCGISVFSNVPKKSCVLYVPKGSKEAYSTAKGWKSFKHIEEM